MHQIELITIILLLVLVLLQWRIEVVSAFVLPKSNHRQHKQQKQQIQQRTIKWKRIQYKSSSYTTSRQILLQVQQQQQQQQQQQPQHQHVDDISFSSLESKSESSTTIITTIFPETNYLLHPKLIQLKISNKIQQQRLRRRILKKQQQLSLSNIDNIYSNNKKSFVSLLLNNTNFLYQLIIMILLYIFHLTILTQYQLVLPFQLLPFSVVSTIQSTNINFYKGCCIGYDSLAGILIVVLYCYIQNKQYQYQQYQYQQNQQQQDPQQDFPIQRHEEQDEESTIGISTQEDILQSNVNDTVNVTTLQDPLVTELEAAAEIETISVSDTVSDLDPAILPADDTIISISSVDPLNHDNDTSGTLIDDNNTTTIGSSTSSSSSSSSSRRNTSSFKLIRSVYNPELAIQPTFASIVVSTIDTSLTTEQTTTKNHKTLPSSSSLANTKPATVIISSSSSSFVDRNRATKKDNHQQRFKLLPNLFTSPDYNNDATPWNLPSYMYSSHNEQNNNNNDVNINQADESTSIRQDQDTAVTIKNSNEEQQQVQKQLTFQEKVATIVNGIKTIIDYIVTPYRLLRVSYTVSTILLIIGYFNTAKLTLFWEDCIYSASAKGLPITIPLQRSLLVLTGHLSWVLIGTTILTLLPQPSFFTRNVFIDHNNNNNDEPIDSETDVDNTVDTNKDIPLYKWFTIQVRNPNKQWVWWSIGGYYVSSWLFNVADVINQVVLPTQVLFGTYNGLDGSMNSGGAVESVVTQLVNPEYNDFIASLVGYIAPCLSAPIWEELLYRGYLLPGLIAIASRIRRTKNDTNTKKSKTTNTLIEDTSKQRIKSTTYHWVCVIQAIIFSAHHMSINAAIPLAVLGYIWAVVYTKSQNLLTVILIHSMWNSRVFLGSWLGL